MAKITPILKMYVKIQDAEIIALGAPQLCQMIVNDYSIGSFIQGRPGTVILRLYELFYLVSQQISNLLATKEIKITVEISDKFVKENNIQPKGLQKLLQEKQCFQNDIIEQAFITSGILLHLLGQQAQKVYFRNGTKYGCHLLLYPGHFSQVHSKYMVYISSEDAFDGHHVVALTSIAKSVNKEVMLISYSKNDITSNEIQQLHGIALNIKILSLY